MKSRELLQTLAEAGGVVENGKGDHKVVTMPCGRKISVPHGGRQNEVSPGMIAKAKRFLKNLPLGRRIDHG